MRHARGNRFRAGQAFRKPGHFGAPRGQFFLLGLRRLPQGYLPLHGLRDFLLRFRPRVGNFAALDLRGFGALLGCGRAGSQPREFRLAIAQFDAQPHHVATRLIALQCGRHRKLFGFDVLRGGLFESRSAGAKFFFNVLERGLRFRRCALELQHFHVQRAQFALHAQRARFRRASAADYAALISRSVRRDERVRGIFSREPLGHFGLFHEERGLQARQELFCRRAQRIAKLHEAVQA